ncbi:MAG TPA: RagB/SusD family nutrient uptake outer membrane protein [Chryseosolibacter sp.]
MKKLITYTVAAIAVISSGCSEDFLDSQPLTQVTEANFYKTADDAQLALVGCYDGLQRLNSVWNAFPVTSEWLSDNCFGAMGYSDGYGQQVIDEFDPTRSPGDVNLFDGNWSAYYQGIFRVNMLLSKLDDIAWGDNVSLRNSIEAEARFLRAYFYFDLVRLFEKVPLITEPTIENVPQSEPDAVYDLITEDLMFAAANASEEVTPGRVNKWVAKSLIARVFLFYTGYYQKADLAGKVTKADALNGLEEVIQSGHYGLVAEFKNLWPAASTSVSDDGTALQTTYAGKDNVETVFAIKHNITSNWNGNADGNHWLVMISLRVQSFPPYGKGWGGATVSKGLYDAFEPGDARRDASVIAIQEEGLAFDVKDQREYTGYSNKKYTNIANPDGQDVSEANGGVSFQISQYQDYVVMRYADVLLMAAELGSANAQDYFDEVRARAGLTAKALTPASLMEERRFEFAFEGIRYWDLLRQGLQTAATAVATNVEVMNGGSPATKTIKAENLMKTRGFQQIPNSQITLSGGVLKQNPGWE